MINWNFCILSLKKVHIFENSVTFFVFSNPYGIVQNHENVKKKCPPLPVFSKLYRYDPSCDRPWSHHLAKQIFCHFPYFWDVRYRIQQILISTHPTAHLLSGNYTYYPTESTVSWKWLWYHYQKKLRFFTHYRYHYFIFFNKIRQKTFANRYFYFIMLFCVIIQYVWKFKLWSLLTDI
jgi:hypothetical protein